MYNHVCHGIWFVLLLVLVVEFYAWCFNIFYERVYVLFVVAAAWVSETSTTFELRSERVSRWRSDRLSSSHKYTSSQKLRSRAPASSWRRPTCDAKPPTTATTTGYERDWRICAHRVVDWFWPKLHSSGKYTFPPTCTGAVLHVARELLFKADALWTASCFVTLGVIT